MNELTQIPQQPPSDEYRTRSEAEALSTELAKMLGLVAPVTMSADQQALWIVSAVDALRDIRPNEVAEVSMQVRRTVTRPSQIVPEIAKLVADRRSHRARMREYEQPALPPIKHHIADRDRKNFTAEDWAELNQHLERMGATVRYQSDGTRYSVEAT
jgi:hypothetical protein